VDVVNDPRCYEDPESPVKEYAGDIASDPDLGIVQAIRDDNVLPDIPMYVIDEDKVRIIEPSNTSQYNETINRCGY
jgi:hypothetical protein